MYHNNIEPFIEGEEWRPIPLAELAGFEASSLGRIRNTNGLKTQSIEKGYYYITANQEKWRVHRLVALTFLQHPLEAPLVPTDTKDSVPFQVNHLTGNKTDNRAESLEWSTAKNNAQHAVDNGLNTRSISVEVTDCVSNTVTSYPSVKSAARALGISTSVLGGIIHNHEIERYRYRYLFKILNEDRIGLHENPLNTKIVFKDYVTGKVSTSNSISSASMVTGVTQMAISRRVQLGQDKLTSGYVFRELEDELEEWPVYSKEEAEENRKYYTEVKISGKQLGGAKRIEVLDTLSKEVKIFESLRAAIAVTKDTYVDISKIMNLQGPLQYFGRYIYKHHGDDRCFKDAIHKPKLIAPSYVVKVYATGEIINYANAGEFRAATTYDVNLALRAQTAPYKTKLKNITTPGLKPYKGMWVVKDEGQAIDWPEFSEDELAFSMMEGDSPTYKCRNYNTDELKDNMSASDVKALLGRSPGDAFKYQEHPKFPIRTNHGWFLKQTFDNNPWPIINCS